MYKNAKEAIEDIKKGKNPKEVAETVIKENGLENNPIINKLLASAEKGDFKFLQTFAQNFFKR